VKSARTFPACHHSQSRAGARQALKTEISEKPNQATSTKLFEELENAFGPIERSPDAPRVSCFIR
jgi:hypothetical protein